MSVDEELSIIDSGENVPQGDIGSEAGNIIQYCTICSLPGHNARTCPEKIKDKELYNVDDNLQHSLPNEEIDSSMIKSYVPSK